MSVSHSDSETEEPIAYRTRSRVSRPTSTRWCNRACTTRDIRVSDPDSSSSHSYLETEFPVFRPGIEMDQGNPALPHEVLELLALMTDRLHAHDDHIRGGPPRAAGLQPPIFKGSVHDDFDEWLVLFNRYATFNGRTPNQMLNGFMMFLGGSALRFCQRQTEEVRADLQALQQALREAFATPHQQFLRRQELNNRTQGPLEPLESYIDDIDTRASRLQLTNAETMQCFVQGLRQDLKEHVILQLPETYAAAVDAARLKNSLSRPNLSASVEHTPRVSTLPHSPTSNQSSSASPSNPTYVTREEFLNLQSRLNNMSPANTQQAIRPNVNTSFRNRRSTDGRPICNRCDRVGHVASRCFANLNRPNQFPQTRDPNPRNFSVPGQFYPPRQPNFPSAFRNNFPRDFNTGVQQQNRPSRFPALPPPRPPPPPPLQAFQRNDLNCLETIEPYFQFARRKEPLSHKGLSTDLRKTFYLTIPSKIEGVATDALIDTVSVMTVISQDLWGKIQKRSNLILCKTSSAFRTAHTASGEIVQISGEVNLNYSIGNEQYVIKTRVVPKLSYAAILGQDFFETFDCIIDFKVGYLKIGRDHLVHFNSPKSCSLQNDTNQCETEVPDPQLYFHFHSANLTVLHHNNNVLLYMPQKLIFYHRIRKV